ncbi:hypothetical protein BD414DRAFT_483661 [Trametes punicea]|nr:hypothetical protein BD414DRAFT_483661 [Trametes punicea]
MSHFKERLRTIEDDFLSALSEGGDALVSFENRWDNLYKEIDAAIESTSIDAETLAFAHATALRCATLADLSIETFTSCEAIGETLMNELETIISELHVSADYSSDPSTSRSSVPCSALSGTEPKRGRAAMDEVQFLQRSSKRRRLSVRPRAARGPTAPLALSTRPSLVHLTDMSATSTAARAETPGREGSSKRKRCASDAELASRSSPSKRRYIGPRLQAVSDSFPVSLSKRSVPSLAASCSAEFSSDLAPSSAAADVRTASRPSIFETESKDQLLNLQDSLYRLPWTEDDILNNACPPREDPDALSTLEELNELLRFVQERVLPARVDSNPSQSLTPDPLMLGYLPPSTRPLTCSTDEDADAATLSSSSSASSSSPSSPSPLTPPDQYLELQLCDSPQGEVAGLSWIEGSLFSDIYSSSCQPFESALRNPAMWESLAPSLDIARPSVEGIDHWPFPAPPYLSFLLPAIGGLSTSCGDVVHAPAGEEHPCMGQSLDAYLSSPWRCLDKSPSVVTIHESIPTS